MLSLANRSSMSMWKLKSCGFRTLSIMTPRYALTGASNILKCMICPSAPCNICLAVFAPRNRPVHVDAVTVITPEVQTSVYASRPLIGPCASIPNGESRACEGSRWNDTRQGGSTVLGLDLGDWMKFRTVYKNESLPIFPVFDRGDPLKTISTASLDPCFYKS